MDAQKLAQAVVHWLEFEKLCGREKLFNEGALKVPIHQYFAAAESLDVFLEVKFPGLPQVINRMQGRKKSLDFCLRRPGGARVFKDVIESKFVTANRAFAQEVLNDLFRLRWMRRYQQTEPIDRWLLLAGKWGDIYEQVLRKGSTKQHPVVDTGLYGTLHRNLGLLHTADVQGASQKHRNRWQKAAQQLAQQNIPTTFRSRLEAQFPLQPETHSYACMIWYVVRPT